MISVLCLVHIFFGAILAITAVIQCKSNSKKAITSVESPVRLIFPVPTTKSSQSPVVPVAPAAGSSIKQSDNASPEIVKKEEGKSEVKEPEPKKTESVVEKKEKEKMEDTFEAIQPKQQDAGRKKELGDKKKAENKGDYKTWNKVIENSEFNKTLSEKDEKDGKKKTGKKDDEKKEDDDKKEGDEKKSEKKEIEKKTEKDGDEKKSEKK
ncbi:hypothetical protein CRE_20302 [Caenorhabditis remanei]|uniref:Uncharacterized protein n=1 Tax=Caenorhabditis remanei TaxID=31234 RepID=E3MCM8_CAERE|nr:hypothetical protein CRE_20302 [Caenorhabditis remanei]